ncbi:MAG: hypothetical protein MHM6MM_006219 [Cercozoa sp. M6MM]
MADWDLVPDVDDIDADLPFPNDDASAPVSDSEMPMGMPLNLPQSALSLIRGLNERYAETHRVSDSCERTLEVNEVESGQWSQQVARPAPEMAGRQIPRLTEVPGPTSLGMETPEAEPEPKLSHPRKRRRVLRALSTEKRLDQADVVHALPTYEPPTIATKRSRRQRRRPAQYADCLFGDDELGAAETLALKEEQHRMSRAGRPAHEVESVMARNGMPLHESTPEDESYDGTRIRRTAAESNAAVARKRARTRRHVKTVPLSPPPVPPTLSEPGKKKRQARAVFRPSPILLAQQQQQREQELQQQREQELMKQTQSSGERVVLAPPSLFLQGVSPSAG